MSSDSNSDEEFLSADEGSGDDERRACHSKQLENKFNQEKILQETKENNNHNNFESALEEKSNLDVEFEKSYSSVESHEHSSACHMKETDTEINSNHETLDEKGIISVDNDVCEKADNILLAESANDTENKSVEVQKIIAVEQKDEIEEIDADICSKTTSFYDEQINIHSVTEVLERQNLDIDLIDRDMKCLPADDKKTEETLSSNITDIYCLDTKSDGKLHEEGPATEMGIQKTKNVSKIGLKKPRERLSRKLGTKISQPLDTVSCDDNTDEIAKRKVSLNSEGSWEKINSDDLDLPGNPQTDAWSSNWGNWGTSLLSAASTLQQEVSKGVGSVVELVEDGLNIPSPEELAQEQKERERWIKRLTDEKLSDVPPTPSPPPLEAEGATGGFGLNFGGFSSLVSGVSDVGSKVMTGGLDTLELIGKKTMTVLKETDPNLKIRKDLFASKVNKPNLSAVLREARELAQQNTSTPSSPRGDSSSCRITYQNLWDNSTGPAHLEALALIARQAESTTDEITNSFNTILTRKADRGMSFLRDLSKINEENLSEGAVFSKQVSSTIKLLNLPLNSDNIAQCWTDLSDLSHQYSEGSDTLRDAVTLEPETVETNLLGSCVSLVEKIVSVAHKAAEMSLSNYEAADPVELAQNYRQLAVMGGSHLESCVDTVCTGLSKTEQYEALAPVITNIYMQVCEGTSCLQQSLVHLCTTMELVHVQQVRDSSS